MSDKLKTCPFCGGVAEVESVGDCCWVECNECGSRTDEHTGNLSVLYAIWNQRQDAEQIAALQEQLKAHQDFIKKHNADINNCCDARTCLAYTDRGLQCPDCPKDWLITPPTGSNKE